MPPCASACTFVRGHRFPCDSTPGFGANLADNAVQGNSGLPMKRREFIGVVAGIAVSPFAVRAQQKALQVVGYLHSGNANSPNRDAFLEGLKETGYLVGQNVAIEYRWAEGQYDQSQALAADLVGRLMLSPRSAHRSRAQRRTRPRQFQSFLKSATTRSRQGWSAVSPALAVMPRA
jgi:hypothetical protein